MPVGAVPFPFGICRICKDRATGVHYGVTTCEGCKGFFKRSITRGDKYKCYFGGSCDLTPKNRNRCKSCRFKKCLDVGMSVEAVRMGRIPKVDKEKALEVFQQGGSNYNNLEIQVEMNGKGTYDFKINPKDEDRKSAQQNRSDDKTEDRPFNQEAVINHSALSQNLQGKIDCDQLEESQGSFQHNVSFNMSKVNRQFTAAESFPGAVSGFDMFARTHINQHPKNSNNARTLGEKSTLRSETFSAQELLHSDQKNLLDCKQDSNSFLEHYGDRQESCKNFGASFTTCDTQSSKNASCRNLNRWHSYDSTLNNPSLCMFDTPLQGTLSSYQSQDFSFDTNKNSPSLQQQLLPHTREGADIEATLDSTPKQATVSMFDIHSSYQERNKPLPQLLQPDGPREFRMVEKEFPFPESQSTHCMASVHEDLENTSVHKHQENKCVHKHFQNTSGSFFKDFTENQGSNIDSELGYTYSADDGKSFAKKQKREAECFTSLGKDNWFPKQGGISGEEDNQELENQVELLKQRDDLSPACNQSLKNSSSLGSVISNEGSNSSQRSGYSPAVIQLLLDQVIEFDKGHKLKEKLKQMFQETETDQVVVMHLLNLINIAEEKAKKGNNWDSKDELRLDELPESKFDGMNRFLNDLCNNIQSSEPPLVKKKRIAETQFYESFENLEVEKSALFHSEEHGPNNRLAGSGRNEIFPHSQQVSSNLNEKNIRNMNSQMHSLGVSMDPNFDMPTPNVQVSPSRNPVFRVQSGESAFSQNQHLHSQPVLGSQGTSHTSSQGIRLTGSQRTSHTSSQGIRLTGSQGTSHTSSQGIRLTGSQGTSHTSSQGIRLTGSQGTSLTSSQGIRLTRSQGTSLTSSQGTRPTSNQGARLTDHGTCCNLSSVSSVGLCSQCAQVPVSQSSLERSKTYALQPTEFKQLEEFDNTVTSTNASEECPRDVEDFQKTLDCMNLGVKILNRFKPEHREKIRLYKQGQLHLRILTDSDEDCAAIYEKLMKGIPGLNDRILGFCESVPGFSSLPKQDKEKLIKRSYYDMWTLSYAEYFQNGESFWILPSGEIYSAQAMRKILNDEMVDTIMKFADEFNSLKLTDLETALFAAVRLTLSAGVDIEDKTGVDNLHTRLLNTFTFEMERNHPTNHVQLLVTVFRLVPLIETINRIQSEIIANFSINRFKKNDT